MRKVIFYVNMSLDGFTAGPKGELDWLIPHAITEESWLYVRDMLRTVDTVLLGRSNYEGFSHYWPSVATNPSSPKKDVEFSRWLDDATKIVFSRTLRKVDWKNARLAKGGVEEVSALKKQPGKDMLIMTSTQLGQSLVDLDLVDEYRLIVLPSLLGRGKALFDGRKDKTSLSLVKATPFKSTGAIALQYAVKRS